jgi:hypothetical protein
MHLYRGMENETPQKQNQNNLLFLFPEKAGIPPLGPRKKNPSDGNGHDPTFLFSFLTDLVHCIKGSLLSINSLASSAIESFDNPEFPKRLQTSVAKDVKKIDSVLNTLLNYISINTPLAKTNTLNIILEEILEANDKQLRDKRIHIFKNCEDDLPQTFMHPEQLRFVLSSLLHYAILLTPLEGNIGFSVKYFHPQDPVIPHPASSKNNGAYIGISIGFSSGVKDGECSGPGSGGNGPATPEPQKDEAVDLILKLVTEIVERNRGTLRFIADEKGLKTLITLKLSLERRKAIHYEPINI